MGTTSAMSCKFALAVEEQIIRQLHRTSTATATPVRNRSRINRTSAGWNEEEDKKKGALVFGLKWGGSGGKNKPNRV